MFISSVYNHSFWMGGYQPPKAILYLEVRNHVHCAFIFTFLLIISYDCLFILHAVLWFQVFLPYTNNNTVSSNYFYLITVIFSSTVTRNNPQQIIIT